MGTNFYAIFKACPHCGHGESIHIGKRSAGWKFSFHGTDTIRSWVDWKEKLSDPSVLIQNEYGERLTFDEFRQTVEATEGHDLDHINECLEGVNSPYHTREYARNGLKNGSLWHDPEGWSFSSGEFS